MERLLQPSLRETAEVVIKKSRFIGTIVPVNSVDAAESALAGIRADHKSANHNCFGYTVGLGVPVERFSDDGEPSGTAGRPILEIVRRRELRNTLIVVTRYFGGTLLGANGLVRAYTETAAAAVDAADMLVCEEMRRLDVVADYAHFGKLEYELTGAGHTLLDKVFTDKVGFCVWLPVAEVQGLVERIGDWSNGQADVSVGDPEWVGVTPEGEFVFGVLQEG